MAMVGQAGIIRPGHVQAVAGLEKVEGPSTGWHGRQPRDEWLAREGSRGEGAAGEGWLIGAFRELMHVLASPAPSHLAAWAGPAKGVKLTRASLPQTGRGLAPPPAS